MKYIPASRVELGLTTSGGEYVYAGSYQNYVGAYYKLFDGRIYSGYGPNDTTTQPLIKVEIANTGVGAPATATPVVSVFRSQQSTDPSPTEVYAFPNTEAYVNLTSATRNTPSKLYPYQHTVQPVSQDYTNGSFVRYFAKKENEMIYFELNKSFYDGMVQKQTNYFWQYFKCFSMSWRLTGNKNTVYQANKAITQLTERNNKIIGLQKFLQEDYLKFYNQL